MHHACPCGRPSTTIGHCVESVRPQGCRCTKWSKSEDVWPFTSWLVFEIMWAGLGDSGSSNSPQLLAAHLTHNLLLLLAKFRQSSD